MEPREWSADIMSASARQREQPLKWSMPVNKSVRRTLADAPSFERITGLRLWRSK
jgi:hypothetical protein